MNIFNKLVTYLWRPRYLENSNHTTEVTGTNFFDILPDEILIHLLNFFCTGELLILSITCKRFFDLLLTHDHLWQRLCEIWFEKQGFEFKDKYLDITSLKDVLNICNQLQLTKNWKWMAKCLANGNVLKCICVLTNIVRSHNVQLKIPKYWESTSYNVKIKIGDLKFDKVVSQDNLSFHFFEFSIS